MIFFHPAPSERSLLSFISCPWMFQCVALVYFYKLDHLLLKYTHSLNGDIVIVSGYHMTPSFSLYTFWIQHGGAGCFTPGRWILSLIK